MEIKGRLVKVLPAQTGQGRNGEWKKQEFVLELDGTYPRKLCISAWNDKVNVETLTEGTVLNVYFDAESREFNGKWYTNLTAWKVEQADDSRQSAPPMPPIDTYQPDDIPSAKDDLPF
jgi:hypothetical protein